MKKHTMKLVLIMLTNSHKILILLNHKIKDFSFLLLVNLMEVLRMSLLWNIKSLKINSWKTIKFNLGTNLSLKWI
jgi:hypothetical protein